MKRKVVITGMGCITADSVSVEEFWEAQTNAKSAIGPIHRFDAGAYRSKIAGEITHDISAIVGFNVVNLSRNAQFAVAAAKQAITDAAIDQQQLDPKKVGICLGSGLGGMYFSEESIRRLMLHGPDRISPMTVPYVDPNSIVNQIAIRWGFSGPQFTVATACSSAAHAMGNAMDLIRSGRVDAVITGGVEAAIAPLFFAGFDKLRAMSTRNDTPASACRPFSGDRDGFVMGEGGAVFVLEEKNQAIKRGAKIYAELLGYGASGGGYHTVMPQPDGRDSAEAMTLALADAEIGPEQIALINPHGTGTKLNDESEYLAMHRVFGESLADIHLVPTKQLTGHLLGAAAAIEALHVIKSLENGIVTPIQYYDGSYDLKINCEKQINEPIRYAMSNSFGFGNNNASLIFGAYQ